MSNLTLHNIIMYLRKSRSDDPSMTVEDVLSRHETQLQEYMRSNYGATLPESQIYREVVSGETIDDRPVMKDVLKLLETGEVNGVLVIEPQRLSRGDLEDCGRIVNSFRYTSTLVITPPKTYDLANEYDRKFFEMELTRGNDYLEYTKKILNRGRIASVKQGNFIGSVAPYGYRKVKVGTGKDACHTLEIIPEQADAVRLMYQLYLAGNGFTNIASHLDRLGIKPLKGDHWSPCSISDMLENPVYIGKVRWNYFRTVKKMENGQIRKSRPINRNVEEIILVNGKHPAIISPDIFAAAAERRGKSPKIKRGTELRNPFAGLVYCGTCGKAMSLKQYVDRRRNSGHRLQSMICPNQRNCHTKSVQYSAFSARVREDLVKAIDDFEFKLKNEDGAIDKIHKKNIYNLKTELVRLKNKDLRQKDAYEDGIYTKEEYASRNAKLQEQIAKTNEALQKAEETLPPEIDYREKIIRFKNCLETFDNPEASAAEKNVLLKGCIQKIIYHNSNESRVGIGRYADNPFDLDVFLRL